MTADEVNVKKTGLYRFYESAVIGADDRRSKIIGADQRRIGADRRL